MKYLIFLIALIGISLIGNLSAEAKKPDDLTCITYLLWQTNNNRQKPKDEEWLIRVVNVESSVLFLHKLSKAEKSKIFEYYLFAIAKNSKYRSHIESFVEHLCMTEISDSERVWLARELTREVSNL